MVFRRRLGIESLESRCLLAPVVTAGGTSLYVENHAPIFIAPGATVTDAASYAGDDLTINVAGGATTDDRLTIAPSDRLTLMGDSIEFDGVEIGTFGDQTQTVLPIVGNNAPLVISLNAAATKTSIEALLHRITFATLGENPATQVRTIVYDITQTRPSETLVYKQVNGVDLHVTVFKPDSWQAGDQRPAVLFFHGGAFTAGVPEQFQEQASYFASRGMVAINVEYRLLAPNPTGPPLDALHDAKSAVRWVREHAVALGIDPTRVAAAGGSAGGYLAAAAGMIDGHDEPGENLAISSKPNLLILFSAVVDNGPDGGYDYALFGDQYQQLSPAYNISSDDPPVLFFHGGADNLLPEYVVQRFQTNLQHAMPTPVPVELDDYPGVGHTFFNFGFYNGQYYFDTIQRTDAYLASLPGGGWLQGSPTIQPSQALLFTEGGLAAIGKNYSRVSVAAVNDAPVIAPQQQSLVSSASGVLIKWLVTKVNDPDGPSALKGIAVTSAGSSNGHWQYATDGRTWKSLDGVSETSARVLAADAVTRIRFVPNAGFHGAARLYFRAWDQTQGILGGLFNTLSHRGGSNSCSTGFDSLTMNAG
jgi:acetyl esterase/lipase